MPDSTTDARLLDLEMRREERVCELIALAQHNATRRLSQPRPQRLRTQLPPKEALS